MSKVSIIIPIYNVEQYLEECLESVCRQTLKDIEIICVNDGSTDSSLDIMNRYAKKDGRIVVLTGPNGGYGKAMNKGLDRASGEYIGIVEPDDYIGLDMYEDLYKIAADNDLDWVKADFYRFSTNENGDLSMKYNHLDSTGERYRKLLTPDTDPSVVKFIMNTWSGIYKRSFIEKYHIRHNETPGASFQDNGFFFQTMIYAERAMIVDKPYYRNRRDNPNSSVKSKEKVYCMNVEYDYIRDILMKDKGIWERYKEMYSWKKFQSYQFTINRISDEYRLPYIKRMGAEFKRAYENGEFSREIFKEMEWERLSLMMQSPEGYFNKCIVAPATDKRLAMEIDEIKSSTTFKVGRIIMFVPCSIKRAILKKLS